MSEYTNLYDGCSVGVFHRLVWEIDKLLVNGDVYVLYFRYLPTFSMDDIKKSAGLDSVLELCDSFGVVVLGQENALNIAQKLNEYCVFPIGITKYETEYHRNFLFKLKTALSMAREKEEKYHLLTEKEFIKFLS